MPDNLCAFGRNEAEPLFEIFKVGACERVYLDIGEVDCCPGVEVIEQIDAPDDGIITDPQVNVLELRIFVQGFEPQALHFGQVILRYIGFQERRLNGKMTVQWFGGSKKRKKYISLSCIDLGNDHLIEFLKIHGNCAFQKFLP